MKNLQIDRRHAAGIIGGVAVIGFRAFADLLKSDNGAAFGQTPVEGGSASTKPAEDAKDARDDSAITKRALLIERASLPTFLNLYEEDVKRLELARAVYEKNKDNPDLHARAEANLTTAANAFIDNLAHWRDVLKALQKVIDGRVDDMKRAVEKKDFAQIDQDAQAIAAEEESMRPILNAKIAQLTGEQT